MAPSANELNALVQGTALEIETLKQIKDGSVTLFDGLITEAHKRIATLSRQEAAAKVTEATTVLTTRSCQQILSTVRRDIDACKRDMHASAARHEAAKAEAEATRKLNVAKTKLVQRAAAALEKTGSLVFELKAAVTAAKPDGSDEFLARVNTSMSEIQSQINQLNVEYKVLHADQNEQKTMIEAKDRAGKIYTADMAKFEKRLKGMRAVEASLVAQMRI